MTPTERHEARRAITELVLFLPVLILLVFVALAATEYVADRRHVAYVTEQAARFATGAPEEVRSPRPHGTAPTPTAVAAYVEEMSDLPVAEVKVTPDPTLLLHGTPVTVTVTVHHDLGPLADLADALAGLLGRDQDLSGDGIDLHSSVTKPKV